MQATISTRVNPFREAPPPAAPTTWRSQPAALSAITFPPAALPNSDIPPIATPLRPQRPFAYDVPACLVFLTPLALISVHIR